MTITETGILQELCNGTLSGGELPGRTVVGYCPGHANSPPKLFVTSLGEKANAGFRALAARADKVVVGSFSRLPGGVPGESGQDNMIKVGTGGSGTAGALVTGPQILSCSHVLCPGSDAVRATNRNGEIVGEVSICSALAPGCPMPVVHRFDAALATYTASLIIASYNLTTIMPEEGDEVSHFGAHSGKQEGIVACRSAYVRVLNGSGSYLFKDQILVIDKAEDDRFATSGDSGSMVVDTQSRPVGLLHATSAVKVTFSGRTGYLHVVCPIDPILEHFGVELIAHNTLPFV